MAKRVVRWDGDGLNDEVSQATGVRFDEPSLTKQSDKDAADINVIMRRYEKTGALPDMIAKNPMWGDFSSVPSFQEALEIVSKAEEQFNALDAHIRDRFNHDPAEFLAFATDGKNKAEMVRLGLAKAPESSPQEAAPSTAGSAPGSTSKDGVKA